MDVKTSEPVEPIKPKAILKLVEQEKSGHDSGLADSRNVTFSPVLATKVIEFSPLVISDGGNGGAANVSVCVPGQGSESESEEITIDLSLEHAPSGPMQSSGLTDMGFNAQDISTINRGQSYNHLYMYFLLVFFLILIKMFLMVLKHMDRWVSMSI